jgi:hypothetical protein
MYRRTRQDAETISGEITEFHGIRTYRCRTAEEAGIISRSRELRYLPRAMRSRDSAGHYRADSENYFYPDIPNINS